MFKAIKNFWQYGSIQAKAGVIIFCIFNLVIIIIAIVNLLAPILKEDYNVQVANFDETTNVPKDYQEYIQKLIWKKIENNMDISGVVYEDAKVRDSSYQEETEGEVVTASFIIDIEKLRYSFAVAVRWNTNKKSIVDPDIQITCPHYLDVIYTDTKCIATTPAAQISRYLPHYETIPDGKKISINFRVYEFYQAYAGEQYLAVEVKACQNAETISLAKSAAINWIKSIYLDPNDYHMEIVDSCH